jgi:hypothetical protein
VLLSLSDGLPVVFSIRVGHQLSDWVVLAGLLSLLSCDFFFLLFFALVGRVLCVLLALASIGLVGWLRWDVSFLVYFSVARDKMMSDFLLQVLAGTSL